MNGNPVSSHLAVPVPELEAVLLLTILIPGEAAANCPRMQHLLEVVRFPGVPVLKSQRLPGGHPEEAASSKITQMFAIDQFW